MKTYVVEGARVDSRAALFAEFGRAVNGPDGYFGRNLDALADCLRGGFGTPEGEPFRFLVTDYEWVKAALSEESWNGLLAVFEESGIELILEPSDTAS